MKITPHAIHEAMQDAPVDDQLYRQSRAALRYIETRYKLVYRLPQVGDEVTVVQGQYGRADGPKLRRRVVVRYVRAEHISVGIHVPGFVDTQFPLEHFAFTD